MEKRGEVVQKEYSEKKEKKEIKAQVDLLDHQVRNDKTKD